MSHFARKTQPSRGLWARAIPLAALGLVTFGISTAPAAGAQSGQDVSEAHPVENQQALRHFYRSLRASEGSERDAVTRVMVYSESTNAADRVTSAVKGRIRDIGFALPSGAIGMDHAIEVQANGLDRSFHAQ